MKSRVVRTAVISAAITTVLVTAITLFALPKVPSPTPVDPVLRTSSTPAPVYDPDPNKPTAGRVVLPSDVRDNSVEADIDPAIYGGTTRQRRSTARSAAIIAGSAGTGAAIGAIAKGGKGAAIGAISGAIAGYIYDRMTADPKPQQARTQVVRR
jgi:hypothetical protein